MDSFEKRRVPNNPNGSLPDLDNGFVDLNYGFPEEFRGSKLNIEEDTNFLTGVFDFNAIANKFKNDSFKLELNSFLVGRSSIVQGSNKNELKDYLLKNKKKPKYLYFLDDEEVGRKKYISNSKSYILDAIISSNISKIINKGNTIFNFKISYQEKYFRYRVVFPFNKFKYEERLSNKYGLIIESKNFDGINVFLNDIGIDFPNNLKEEIKSNFKPFLINIKNDKTKVEEIYYYTPNFILKDLENTHIIQHLKILLDGWVTERKSIFGNGINIEKLVLKILNILYQKSKDADNFLNILLLPSNQKNKTILEQLFFRIDNKFGDENFTKLVEYLYEIWKLSTFSDFEYKEYNTTNGASSLPYKSNKFLGFYYSNTDLEFNNKIINVSIETGEYEYTYEYSFREKIKVPKKKEIVLHYNYHSFQPVLLTEIVENSNLEVAGKIPAFFLLANESIAFWSNVLTSVEYGVDILTTISGVGNIAKFRHLAKLANVASRVKKFQNAAKFANTVSKIKLAAGTIEVASGTVNVLIKLSGADSDFARALQKYLFYLELATLAGELKGAVKQKIRQKIKKHAKEALSKKEDIVKLQKNAGNLDEVKEIDDVVKHLDEVAELERDIAKFTIENKGKNITAKQFNKVAKRIFKAHGVKLHLVESGKLFDLWKSNPIFATFHHSKFKNRRYEIVLDGPAIYFFKGIDNIGRKFEMSSYTLQHELFHLEFWFKMNKKYPKLAELYNRIPNVLHELDVIGNFVKQNRIDITTKWDLENILYDIDTLNENIQRFPIWRSNAEKLLGKTKFELKDFDNWNLNTHIKKL